MAKLGVDVQLVRKLAALLEETGLVELESNGVRVTSRGWYLVRAVAMVFDRHLRSDRLTRRWPRRRIPRGSGDHQPNGSPPCSPIPMGKTPIVYAS